MKKLLSVYLFALVIAILAGSASAQEGVTYLKYHLAPAALPFSNVEMLNAPAETARLALENGKLDEIDVYFAPAVSHFTLGQIADWQERSPALIKLNIAYDKISDGQAEDPLLRDEQHLLRGKLHLPLGESSFSLGAYVALYTATVENILAESPKTVRGAQAPVSSAPTGVPFSAQAAFASTAEAPNAAERRYAPVVTGVNNRKAFLGAVNVSGAVKGVNVFTQIGFASESGGPTENSAAAPLNVTDFYASGGAKYRVGQVTLGVEAGFENGSDTIEAMTDNFPGFENDFWSDRMIEDALPGEQINNKLYARVSAQMNPLQKIDVAGALSCIKAIEAVNGASIYGVGVNGVLYYSLTSYLKYLFKAGVTSLIENASLGERQYKLMNQFEFRF